MRHPTFGYHEARIWECFVERASTLPQSSAKGKAYSPVIALDETQQWNTYSALHDGRLTGYGGGSGRGRGASGAGPSRPVALEQQMPASASTPPIWVAHFHYVAQDSAFDSFVKAHLKTRAQRSLGMTWQKAEVNTGATFADVEIWRGNIDKPFAKKHFEALN
ncbi:hypothetical protein [Pseudomonas orientalis]|uniref:hypothetical protein n=1 Tax=Pseudomonas orientalis TaxID=76758 RepID=UPI002FE31990